MGVVSSIPLIETQAAFAARVGVAPPKISRWKKRGFPMTPQGVPVEAALKWCEANLDPDQTTLQRELKDQPKASGVKVVIQKAGSSANNCKQTDDTSAVNCKHTDEQIAIDCNEAPEPDFRSVRTAHESLKAERAQLELSKARGELIAVSEVKRVVFSRARAERDAWVAFSARTSARLAGELGCDPGLLHRLLSSCVNEQLSELAGLRLEIGGDDAE